MQLDALKIRKKIVSIEKIQKITNSLKIIASMKIKKLFVAANESEKNWQKIARDFALLSPSETASPKNSAWILLTSDLGLCGAYNSQIFALFKAKSRPGDIVFLVGKKGITHFSNKSTKIAWSSPAESFDWAKMNELAKTIATKVLADSLSVKMIGSPSTANSTNGSAVISVLPLVASFENKTPSPTDQELLIEPESATVYRLFLPIYLLYTITNQTKKNHLLEERMRALAMDNASENAGEIADELRLKYNQSRQQKITQEIITVTQE